MTKSPEEMSKPTEAIDSIKAIRTAVALFHLSPTLPKPIASINEPKNVIEPKMPT